MKKGLWFLYSILFVLIAGFSLAAIMPVGTYTCNGLTPYPCVCGHNPNSTLGYGLVIVGPNYITCDNIPDGVCPEKFAEPGGLNASCGSCTDPDCRGYITGTVTADGKNIDKVNITAHPVKWNQSANLETSVLTGSSGTYTLQAPTGTYYFSASKGGYDTLLIQGTIKVDETTTPFNFNLVNGTCHDDCTNSYGRCNAACDGVEFENSNTKCQFYTDATYGDKVKSLCDNRLKSTEVFLGQNASDPSKGIFIQCCGDIDDPEGIKHQKPYQKYYTTLNSDNGGLKNLVKTEKIARYNDVPVRVIVAYWK